MKKHIMMNAKQRDSYFLSSENCSSFQESGLSKSQLQLSMHGSHPQQEMDTVVSDTSDLDDKISSVEELNKTAHHEVVARLQLQLKEAQEAKKALLHTIEGNSLELYRYKRGEEDRGALLSKVDFLQQSLKKANDSKENLSMILSKQSLEVHALLNEIADLKQSQENNQNPAESIKKLQEEIQLLKTSLQTSEQSQQNLYKVVEHKEAELNGYREIERGLRHEIQILRGKADGNPDGDAVDNSDKEKIGETEKTNDLIKEEDKEPEKTRKKIKKSVAEHQKIVTLKKTKSARKSVYTVKNNKAQCPYSDCQKVYLKNNLGRHMREVHERIRKKCRFCSKECVPSSWSKHEATCSGLENFVD